MPYPIEELENKVNEMFNEKETRNRLSSTSYLIFIDTNFEYTNLTRWISTYITDIVESYIQDEINVEIAARSILRRFDDYLIGFRPSGDNLAFITDSLFLLNEDEKNKEYRIALKCSYLRVYPC